MGFIEKLKAKAEEEANNRVHSYVLGRVLPACYVVYRKLMNDHKVVDSDSFNLMILEELKVPQGERL